MSDNDEVVMRLTLAEEFLSNITLHLFEEMQWAGPLSETHRHRLIDIVNEMADMRTEVAEQLEGLN